MKNRDFYNFCRDRRRNFGDANKEFVLATVYNCMRENGVSIDGVNSYICLQIANETEKGHPELVKAYEWLRDVFAGKVSVAEPAQETLF